MALDVSLIVVGKLKDKHLESIELDYLKRIKDPNLTIHEVKANTENTDIETKEIFKEITKITKGSHYHLILLAEYGKELNSPQFSKWLYTKIEMGSKLIFVIGGAEGHSSEIIEKSHDKFSLSKLTYPHKIARILFVEQFYRAQTIKIGHPYHN
jgi:23S rRNA (pseudouridine1915-N3)-methyltransferase